MLDLATCHITQHTKGSEKTDWVVQLNETNEEVFRLPKKMSEFEVFAIIDFARKYELEAFNKGIEFQKDKQNSVLKITIDSQLNLINKLKSENERLANELDKRIRNGIN